MDCEGRIVTWVARWFPELKPTALVARLDTWQEEVSDLEDEAKTHLAEHQAEVTDWMFDSVLELPQVTARILEDYL